MASITSPLTTIALGYDQNGQATRRDQWIGKLVGAFSLTGTVTDDGRVTSSRFTSPTGYGKEVVYYGRFDSAGRPVQVGLGNTAATPVTVAWEAVNDGATSYGAYDAIGRVRLVKSNGGTVETRRNYETFTGNLTSQFAKLNATTGVYGIDNILYLGTKLAGFTDTTVTGTTSTYTNTYDANGRLVSAKATRMGPATLPQAYDQAYSFSDPSWPAGASMGNLEQVKSGGATTGYAYLQDRAVQQTGAEVNSFEYDLAGRVTARKNAAGVEQEGFVYDVQDQLKQVRRGPPPSTTFETIEYDPAGLPLFRKMGDKATWYVGPSATVTGTVSSTCLGAADCTLTGAPVVRVHVLAGGTRVASVKAQSGTGADPISEVLYYHRDLQGSVVATTLRAAGANGKMGVRYRYQPYGQLDKTDTSSLGAGVTWAMADSELGYTGGVRLGHVPGAAQQGTLLLLGARVYHSGLKRWLQADTVDVLRGTYVNGDPANLVDPSGRMAADGRQTTRSVSATRLGTSVSSQPYASLAVQDGDIPDISDGCYRNDSTGELECEMDGQTVPPPLGPGNSRPPPGPNPSNGGSGGYGGGGGRPPRPPGYMGADILGGLLEELLKEAGKATTGRDYRATKMATSVVSSVALSIVYVAALGTPVGWAGLGAAFAAGALANLGAGVTVAKIFGEDYSAREMAFDALSGGVGMLLPGAMSASARIAAGQAQGVLAAEAVLSQQVKAQLAAGAVGFSLPYAYGAGLAQGAAFR